MEPEDICAAFETAWNEHDMVAFGDLFESDATFVNRFATCWRGRDAIILGHRTIHEGIYSDSVLCCDPPVVDRLTDDIAILLFWNRLSVGAAHPAGPHDTDTLIMAVVRKIEGRWCIRAAENVTLTDPRSGAAILRQSEGPKPQRSPPP